MRRPTNIVQLLTKKRSMFLAIDLLRIDCGEPLDRIRIKFQQNRNDQLVSIRLVHNRQVLDRTFLAIAE